MKKRIAVFVVFVIMTLSIGVAAFLIFDNYETLVSIFDGGQKDMASWLYLCIGALITCWLAMFIFLVKLKKNVNVFDYGKTDILTGLGNKKQLRLNFESLSSAYNKYSCLAYIAFDEKRVRNHYGANMLDELQKGGADLLSDFCGDYDSACRLDNGVFALSLCCRDGLHAGQRINEVVTRLNKHQYNLLLDDIAPYRAGIYLPEKQKATFETALANAKVGYSYACDNNVSTFVCTRELLEKDANRNRLKEKLSKAIDQKEFELYLQLLYDVKQNKFVGAEVLSRWNNPTEGLIMPGHYINDMQTTGIIEKFDMYMLDKTCALLESWSNTEFSSLTLSCNITRITVSSVDFLDNFREIIKKYRFDHKRLVLEITEDALIDNQTVAYRNISECKNVGVHFAIDDFGAGHSSLNDLSDYPVDHIKVDRQVVTKVTTERGRALVQGLIQLSHNLQIDVVCEGVETKKQRDIVVDCGCDLIQGYYYSYVFTVEEAQTHYRHSLFDPILH